MSLPVRITALLVAFAAVVVGAAFIVVHYILASPPTVTYNASGGVVNLMLQEDAQNDSASKPDWVSYFVQDPSNKQWVHTTLFSVPKGTTVHVTILGYDGCTPLRNPLWGRVAGAFTKTGQKNAEDVQIFDGKTLSPVTPVSTFDSWADCSVQHTFAIPGLGINVPIASPPTVKENNALCAEGPCVGADAAEGNAPHSVVTFSFKSPSTGGTFRWQCFVPCGGGYVDGNGGPMATLGYMMGQMEVQA